MTRVLLSAAEPSADRYAARLVPALRAAWPGIALEAIAGAETAAHGVPLVHGLDGLQAFGLVETARSARTHVRLYRAIVAALRRGAWDLVILCDYPGFHLRVGQAARAAGVPVLYYIAPQLWAWGPWRTARLRRAADRLAVVLPFEQAFFAARGVPATFVGHPLLDEAPPARAAARLALGIADDAPVLALLPGARPGECARHWPLFRAAARDLGRIVPGLVTVVGAVPGRHYPASHGCVMAHGGGAALAAADVALLKSGTATLEAALANVPAVVSYRLHPVSWWVARRLVRVPWVSLASLVADEMVHPELLQRDATPRDLAARLAGALGDDAARQRAAYTRVRGRLGSAGAAGRVAQLARELAA